MASVNDATVHIRVRYTRWAQFVLRVVSVLHRAHCPGVVLRLIYQVAVFQIRCDVPKIAATRWRWMRVPYPKVSK